MQRSFGDTVFGLLTKAYATCVQYSMEKPIAIITVIIDIGSNLTFHSAKKPITPINYLVLKNFSWKNLIFKTCIVIMIIMRFIILLRASL